jgi:hypothetical protein
VTGENRPISEIYRDAGDDWTDKNAAAQILEDTITLRRAERQLALGEMAVNKSELIVKASQESRDDVAEAIEARRVANKAKVVMEYWKMRYGEWQSEQANSRVEAKL